MRAITTVIIALAFSGVMVAQTVTITDTLYTGPENEKFVGRITVESPDMTCSSVTYVRGTKTYTITSGLVSITLPANTGCTVPTGQQNQYRVRLAPNGNAPTAWTEIWVIPTSPSPTTVRAVRVGTAVATPIGTVALAQLAQSGAYLYQPLAWLGSHWGPLTATDDTLIMGNGTGFSLNVVPDCGAVGKALKYTAATNTFSCGDTISAVAWGGITGTLSAQTDLYAALTADHGTNHGVAGSDPVTLAQSQITNLVTDLSGKVGTGDSRLTDARAPTAHASNHAAAGSDPVTVTEAQVTGLVTDLANKVEGSDSRLTDARVPTAHASSHAAAGSDPMTIPQSQVTDLVTALSGKEATITTLGLAKGGTNNTSWTAGRCVQVAADGTKLEVAAAACGSGSASSPYAVSFSGDTTKTATAATHGLGTNPLDGGCYTVTTGAKINPASWAKNGSGDVTITVDPAWTGTCYLHAGSGYTGGGGDVSSVFGRTGAVVSATNDYAFSQISGTAAISQGGTGATTAAAARVALFPSMTGNALKRVRVNTGATDIEYVTSSYDLEGSATLNSWGTIASGCVDKNITVVGAVGGDKHSPGWPATLEAGIVGMMIPATDLVVVRLCNYSATGIAVADGKTFSVGINR